MTSREKMLLFLLGSTGLLYLWSRTAKGQQAVTYAGDITGGASEYIESAASNIIQSAGEFLGLMTRGERNNNPGNIRKTSTKWQGMALDQSGDKSFVIFATPEAGIRALAIILKNYYRLYGLNTVTQIISRWAPATENPTPEYIGSVADALGVHSDAVINLQDPGTVQALATAIIRQENGRVSYTPDVIATGVDSAFT